jgi:hypothetical protein
MKEMAEAVHAYMVDSLSATRVLTFSAVGCIPDHPSLDASLIPPPLHFAPHHCTCNLSPTATCYHTSRLSTQRLVCAPNASRRLCRRSQRSRLEGGAWCQGLMCAAFKVCIRVSLLGVRRVGPVEVVGGEVGPGRQGLMCAAFKVWGCRVDLAQGVVGRWYKAACGEVVLRLVGRSDRDCGVGKPPAG